MRSRRCATVLMVACAIVVWVGSTAQAQLVTADTNTGGLTAQDLVDILLGPDSEAIVSNISVTGDARCLGSFSGGNSVSLGIDSGISLSTGQLNDAVGPNVADNTTTSFGTPGDPFLDSLQPFPTFDACVLEFDFECEAIDVVSFQYVFGSEEYNEFVGTSFNNVFGFELCPGSGGGCFNNIALVPCNPAVPVAINNVNCGNPFGSDVTTCPNAPFCDQFINNDPSDGGPFFNYEMDGMTALFGAQAGIAPGVNHIKLAISDAGDSVLDSWVFLEGGSFQCGGLCDPDPRSQGYWHHECLALPESEGGIDPGRNGRGPTSGNEDDFASLMECAEARLDDLGFLMTTCQGMDADPPSDKCEKAKKQLTALILNVCADYLQNSCTVDVADLGCGASTVGELIDELAMLIMNDGCNAANDCAEAVNTGDGLTDGLAPLAGTEDLTTVEEDGETARPRVMPRRGQRLQGTRENVDADDDARPRNKPRR